VDTGQQDRITSIARLLDHHQDKGNIRAWRRQPTTRHPERLVITTYNGTDFGLCTVRDVQVFAYALTSADQAAAAREWTLTHPQPTADDDSLGSAAAPIAGTPECES
jgi:hypothetical protein